MTTFTSTLTSSEYGVAVPYANGYVAYVSEDMERGGYYIAYCKANQDMPPHKTEHAATAEDVERILTDCGADFDNVTEIEPEED